MLLQKLSAIFIAICILFGIAIAQEPTVLEVGKPIERELGGGQSHRYQVSLIAGQYLHVVVEQRGIDVLVTLLAPDNKKLTEVDSPNGDQGPESLMWVAETSGTYQVEVLPLIKDAPTARYEIKVVEIRKAEEKDQWLIEANKATTKATQLFGADKPAEALPVAQQALSLREKVFGKNHPETIPALELLAHLSMYKEDFSSAASVSQQILSIYEKSEGAESLNVAEWIGRLGSIYQKQGDFTKAEALFFRSLELIKNLSVNPSPKSARSFEIMVLLIGGSGWWGVPNNPSRHLRAEIISSGKNEDTEKRIYEKALPVAETVYASDSVRLIFFLHNAAKIIGVENEQGEAIRKRALSIVEKIYGAEHPKVAEELLEVAFGSMYRVEAERYYQRAMSILEKVYGAESAQVTEALGKLRFYYARLADYSSVRLTDQRILSISEKLYGQDHPKLAEVLTNIAHSNKLLGDYSQSESAYLRVLTIREKALGTNTRQVYDTIIALADLYDKKREFNKADIYYQKALGISEKITLHPQRKAFLFADIALHYLQAKDYEKAIANYQRGLVLLEKIIPDDPILCWRVLTPLASVYYSAGDYVKAEATLQRSLTIYQKFYGTTYELTVNATRSLALYYARRGDITQALSYLSKACTEGERLISLSLSFGTERQKTQTLTRRYPEFAYALSVATQLAPNNALARDLALTLILQRKARVLETTSDSLAFLRRNATPQRQALLNELSAINTKLAEMLLSGNEAEPRGISAPSTPPANRGQHIQSLELQKEKLEAEISKQSAEFRQQLQPITLAGVRAAIPDNAALLEFFAYRPFNFRAASGENPNGPPHYIVYVARRQGEVQWVDLGERKPIDDAIAAWRRALRDANRADVNQLARIVDEKVMQPVRKLLSDTRKLLISPDGQLNLIPFAALVDEQNRYLVETYQLSYLTSGRDLLRLQDPLPNKSETTIVADPDFGTVTVASAESNAARTEAIHFQPLSGAAREARELKALLPNATLLTKAQATETAVKRLSGPRILHIATHGFFLQTETPELPETRGLGFGREDIDEARLAKFVAQVKDPLIRSGLALAGANQGKSGPNKEDDGVLTALEAAGLDLWGTKLVVLSACDTGVGEVKNGEGVQGLRRAMVLAGAETQVMSLWPVSDNATRDLMVEYYERLQAGEGRGEALRQVQLNLLKGDGVRGVKPLQEGKAAFSGRSHPYYWASFIQSGEWANLEGKR